MSGERRTDGFRPQRRAAAAEGQRRPAARPTATSSSSARLRAEPRTAGAASCGSNMPSSACSALPFAEEHGGFGGGPVETMIVDGGVRPRAGARALSSRPSCWAAASCATAAAPSRCGELVPKIAEGELTPRLRAIPSGRRATTSPTSRPRRARDGARLRARRREERRAARRQRRQADRLGARLRRPARPRTASACSWSTPRRAGRDAPRLSDPGRPARRRDHARRRAGRPATP